MQGPAFFVSVNCNLVQGQGELLSFIFDVARIPPEANRVTSFSQSHASESRDMILAMDDLVSTERFIVSSQTSATKGTVVWSVPKTIWLVGHGLLGLSGVILFPQVDALILFFVLTAATVCIGHSIGMHRLLIHRSFKTHRLTEYVFVWLQTGRKSRTTSDFEVDDVDLAIRHGLGNYPGLQSVKPFTEGLIPVCSPKLFTTGHRKLSVQELKTFTLLHDNIGQDWNLFLSACGADDIDPYLGPKFEGDSLMIQAAIEGHGVALARQRLVQSEIDLGRLIVPLDHKMPSDFAYCATPCRAKGGTVRGLACSANDLRKVGSCGHRPKRARSP